MVDATGSEEQQESTWQNPALSPLCLADGGTLVVLSVAALSEQAQTFLARALAERQSPAGHSAPLDVSLIVSVSTTVDMLVATGRLDPLLADWLGDEQCPFLLWEHEPKTFARWPAIGWPDSAYACAVRPWASILARSGD